MAKKQKPEAVSVETICSVCGLDWDLHGENPTTEDCVELLKAELASRPTTTVIREPVYVPYAERPWKYPRPWYYGEGGYEKTSPYYIYSGTNESKMGNIESKLVTYRAPQISTEEKTI